MTNDWGFVYFLGNDSMPGIYKIGFTRKHPRLRMSELSSASSCPIPFTLLAYFGAYQPQQIESLLHRRFAEFRVNNVREFFRLEAPDMQWAVDHFGDRFDDSVFRSALDALAAGYVPPEPVVEVKVPEKTEEEKERSRMVARERLSAMKLLLQPHD